MGFGTLFWVAGGVFIMFIKAAEAVLLTEFDSISILHKFHAFFLRHSILIIIFEEKSLLSG